MDVATQSLLEYQSIRYIPWNSYTRKIIGYLYAIQHGATHIYDTDDDNAPHDFEMFEQNFEFSNGTTRGLILTQDLQNASEAKSYVKNPYAHFGQGSIWPRGFPLQQIGQEYNNSYIVCPKVNTPLIQQGLVNGDPDVDAIFRLTRKKLHSPLNIKFDGFAPKIIYPKGLFAPFNSQNTVFHYNAFWALFLPSTVSFRVTDIWRGYWSQPLLWKVGGRLGFYSPHATQIRNAHVYLKDFGEEDQMYKQSWDLIELLSNWECPSSEEDGDFVEIYSCMIKLTEMMAGKGMWSWNEVDSVKAWIQDLISVGYNAPSFQIESPECLDAEQQTSAIFSAARIQKDDDKPDLRAELRGFCKFPLGRESSPNNTNKTVTSATFPTTLLVITFNIPHYQNIWLLDLIYRPHYSNILYCGEFKDGVSQTFQNLTSLPNFKNAGVTSFSLIHANIAKGLFAYECANRAIEMNYGTSEYILMSDDILLNFWNNFKFNPKEVWSFRHIIDTNNNTLHIECGEYNEFNLEIPYNSSTWNAWPWWKSPYGLNVTKKAMDGIHSSANADVIEFVRNKSNFGYNVSALMCGPSDIFHFHKRRQEQFYQVAKILRESEVFLEIAVPYLLSGLSSRESCVNLPTDHLWNTDRKTPLTFFNVSKSVIHPVKISEVFANETFRNEYCLKYVRRVLKLSI